MKWQYHIQEIGQSKKADYIETKLAELGEDGWELLVSVDRNPAGNETPSTYLIFKRPS